MAEKSLDLGCVWAILEGLRPQSKAVVRASVENNILIFILLRATSVRSKGGDQSIAMLWSVLPKQPSQQNKPLE
jgi:hypothetical protein